MIEKIELRQRRHKRVRKKVTGTEERPRLTVYKSLSHMYAQMIDDTKGQTLAHASTLDKSLKTETGHKGNVAAAKKVGALIAQKAKEKGISKAVFDKGGFKYHGRVKALAEAAREAGLEF
ncbi:MAG: 50S ribosomal protein L18 [Nitrospirota bacterium]|uniref:Large ribosomal subunit protein uL18 n=1 Tax=Candidatus Magnetominusculus xianensis TaxID=1748249 RepID=A0ABR5SHH6_9BACT|nr:50S ribosomal protein L18 [Candidatus Magnetominusculus xianensis]KWT83410.1 50S ribosomal protein L18 [Candidatus Magnetominusculus xianensis]MBF0403520.1 50S ribosomal protein L18 [Nitrospirota bacterium]